MIAQTPSDLKTKVLVSLTCSSEEDTVFRSHWMAIALHRGMTRTERLEYVFQGRQTTLSHW